MQVHQSFGVFPDIKTKALSGKVLQFPQDLAGRATLLVLVFEDRGIYENAQNQANAWASYWEGHLRSQKIDFYEIPMMSAKYVWLRWYIDGAMRAGIPRQKHANIACFYGHKEKYANVLGIRDLSQAHVFLLDAQGYIRGQVSSYPDSKTVQDLVKGYFE